MRPSPSFAMTPGAVIFGDDIRAGNELAGNGDAFGALEVQAKLRLFRLPVSCSIVWPRRCSGWPRPVSAGSPSMGSMAITSAPRSARNCVLTGPIRKWLKLTNFMLLRWSTDFPLGKRNDVKALSEKLLPYSSEIATGEFMRSSAKLRPEEAIGLGFRKDDIGGELRFRLFRESPRGDGAQRLSTPVERRKSYQYRCNFDKVEVRPNGQDPLAASMRASVVSDVHTSRHKVRKRFRPCLIAQE